jgi:hypothetical protein
VLFSITLKEFPMKSKLTGFLLFVFLSLTCLFGAAHAGPVNLGDPLSATQAADTWYVDRAAPNDFSHNSGTGVLKQTISGVDRTTDTFYQTQGRKHDLGAGTTSMSIELYIPGDLLQQRYAGFWGTGIGASNQVTGYPIIEFATDGVGPRIQGWDDANGWVNYGLPGTFAYDAWHELQIVLDTSNDEWDYLFNGNLLGSVDAFGAVGISNMILQGYNKFTTDNGSYDIRWRDAQANTPESTVPEPGTLALLGVAGISLLFIRRKPAVSKK